MCVSPVCSWIFMNATIEILTVYKEGAYRSIGVCILNRFCTFPSSCCKKPMEFIFSLRYFLVFQILLSKWKDYFRQTYTAWMECFWQTLATRNLLSYSIFEAQLPWQQFGHHLDKLHIFWRSAVNYLNTILLSCCAVRQNPLDWEKGGFCSLELKTEQ